MTVEEFREIPKPVGNFNYELHHGELVKVSRPKHKHHRMQDHLADILKPLLRSAGAVSVELPFRVVPENDVRAADVAFVSRPRWNAIDGEDNLHGAPDLVIEVLSRSNTAAEMYARESLCLANGTKQFWRLDLNRRQIRVVLRGVSEPRIFGCGQRISLAEFGGGTLAVDDVFND